MRLYGKNPVLERLKSQPQSIRRITLEEGHPDGGYIRKKALRWGIPVGSVPRSKIQKMARDINAQGVVIEIDDFAYLAYADLLEWVVKKKTAVFFLDGLTDPQNLGGIIRSLACLGDFGIVLPTHRSVQVTEAVLRVACGGDNFVRVAQVANLGQAIKRAKEAGCWIAGTVVKDGEPLTTVTFPSPLGVVIGSEQKGMRDVLAKQVDLRLTIPMAKPRLSLNVAQATTILAYEIVRQSGTARGRGHDG